MEDLDSAGWLLSNESVQSRLGMLEFNLARHGGVNYFVSRMDPDVLAGRLTDFFDGVLVDAPCSGQSLWSRNKKKQTAAAFASRTIQHCAMRQTRILDAAAQLVRPGGRMVYSTCTFALDENEGQIERFLERHSDWTLLPVATARAWESEYGPGHYRLWPHRDHCGGGYAACMLRSPEADRTMVQSSNRIDSALRATSFPEGLAEWGQLHQVSAYRLGARTFIWPVPVDEELLPVVTSGPELCFRKGSTWFPSYALAMRRGGGWSPLRHVALEDVQAMRYVQGLSQAGTLRGWGVAIWRDQPLGWVKGDGTQLKNHLPKPARLVVQ